MVNSSPAYTAMFAMFSCTWGRAIKKPGTLLFAFIQPLYWIVFFGFLFERYPLLNSDVTLRYLDFLAPGVCVMALLFGASQSGIGFIRDLNNGLLLRILLTPAPLTSVLFGKILADTLRLLMNAMGVGLMAMAMGARLNTSLEVFGFTVMILFVFGWAYNALSCWIALKTRSQELMACFIHLINMPLVFTSNVLVPSRQMPDWLAQLSSYNPLTQVVSPVREALLKGEIPSNGCFALIVLSVSALILFSVATHALSGCRQE